MCQNKSSSVKVFPQPVKPKKVKNTTGYYQCMLNSSLAGFKGQKITQICRNCKTNGNDLNNQRNFEITNLMSAYEQLGQSLRNLLTPYSHD